MIEASGTFEANQYPRFVCGTDIERHLALEAPHLEMRIVEELFARRRTNSAKLLIVIS